MNGFYAIAWAIPLLNHLSLWVNCLRCIQAVHEGLCALRTPHVDLG